MQSINIFIASSYEMAEWRLAIGNAIREWSDRNEPQGFRIRLHCWEDYHPEYTGTRKQDEYNEDLVKPVNYSSPCSEKNAGYTPRKRSE